MSPSLGGGGCGRRSHGSKWQICRSPSPEASISPRCPGRIGWHHHPIASFLIETNTKIKVRNHQRVSSHHMIDMCIFSEAYLPKKEPPSDGHVAGDAMAFVEPSGRRN
jgi:hypothetical protein